jgi:hypothetical protein
MLSRSTKLILVIGLVVIMVVVFLFPGFFPVRIFESVFTMTCTKLINGDLSKVEQTDFTGLGGAPTRLDYIECGKGPAIDANHICYVAPSQRPSFLGGDNPLGRPTVDECDTCQYGDEDIRDGGVLLGKRCKPYRFLWRWEYRTNF